MAGLKDPLTRLSFVFIIWILTSAAADSPPIIEKDVEGIIASFGDFDSDKLTDVFVISSDGRSFSLLQGFKTEPVLRKNRNWSCTLPKEKDPSEKIVALMPSDFHGMAMMDVLVVTKMEPDHYKLYLMKGNKKSLDCHLPSHFDEFSIIWKSQPLVVDINGDMIADILGITLDTTNNDVKRQVMISGFNATFSQKDMFGGEYVKKVIPEINSNAFVDLNADTIPDLFIEGKDDYEYWLLQDGGFTVNITTGMPRTIPFPKFAVRGTSTFLDINSDGIIDHLIPVCHDSDCDNSAIVMLDEYKWVEVATGFHSPKDDKITYGFFVDDMKIQQFHFPMTLRQADFNGDGYPDLVTLMKPSDEGDPIVVVLFNHLSNSTLPGRTFNAWPAPKPYPNSRRPLLVSFFDAFEDGKPDLLMSTIDKKNPDKIYIDLLINTFMDDACFLKVMVASGLCYDDCSGVKGPNSTPTFEPGGENVLVKGVAYGTNQPGPTICHELVDTEGKRRRGCGGQLTQSAFFPLQMPYIIFGLGSTPNFVDMLTATIPIPNSTITPRTRSWTQIVPDAQVVLIPYPIDDPSQWRSKLFLTPSDMVLSTLITLATICILLIIVIAFLHRKEILEDIAEHEEYKRHWPDSR